MNSFLKKKEVLSMGTLYRVALVLVIIGAINWGLIGFFRFDLVATIFGGQTAGFSRIIYALVGLAGLVSIPILMKPLDEEEGTTTYAKAKPNYSMEAGKEKDFSNVADKKKKSNYNNNNNNSYRK